MFYLWKKNRTNIQILSSQKKGQWKNERYLIYISERKMANG